MLQLRPIVITTVVLVPPMVWAVSGLMSPSRSVVRPDSLSTLLTLFAAKQWSARCDHTVKESTRSRSSALCAAVYSGIVRQRLRSALVPSKVVSAESTVVPPMVWAVSGLMSASRVDDSDF